MHMHMHPKNNISRAFRARPSQQ